MLTIEFELVNRAGEANVGENTQLSGDITFALWRPEDDEYLYGGKAPSDYYVCYSGNDIPWSDGKLAFSCELSISANSLAYRIEAGDPVRVEVTEYDFIGTTEVNTN